MARKYKMTIKSVLVSILCILIAGCASVPPVEDNQTERQVINIYDNQGNVKERMIILRFMIRIGRQRGMERCKNSVKHSLGTSQTSQRLCWRFKTAGLSNICLCSLFPPQFKKAGSITQAKAFKHFLAVPRIW